MNAVRLSAPRIKPYYARLILVFVLVAVAAIPLTALWKAFAPRGRPAPDFALTDQDGEPFTLSSLRGEPVVLFFGYTHCPDTCPTTLAHLARAARATGVPADDRVVFVTVDPDRDSPATLKRYVRLFDPRFMGLTGTFKELDPVYAAYDTWRQDVPVQHPRGADYSVAHGATIYYIGRDGTLRGYGHWDDSLQTMIADMKEYQ